jgi:hypothetical protein
LRPISRSNEKASQGRTQSKQPVALVTQALEMCRQKVSEINHENEETDGTATGRAEAP